MHYACGSNNGYISIAKVVPSLVALDSTEHLKDVFPSHKLMLYNCLRKPLDGSILAQNSLAYHTIYPDRPQF